MKSHLNESPHPNDMNCLLRESDSCSFAPACGPVAGRELINGNK